MKHLDWKLREKINVNLPSRLCVYHKQSVNESAPHLCVSLNEALDVLTPNSF